MKRMVMVGGIFLSFISTAHPSNQLGTTCAVAVERGVFACQNSVSVPSHTPGVETLKPAQLLKAYELPGKAKSGTIIALVSAYNAPTLFHDVGMYSKQFGLPELPKCQGPIAQSQVPCLQKVDQRGGHHYSSEHTWADNQVEFAELTHAMCHNCSLLIVESDDNGLSNLLLSADEAVTLGSRYVSLGFIGYQKEDRGVERVLDLHFNRSGVLFTAG